MIERSRIISLLKVLKEYKSASLLASVIHDQVNLILPVPLGSTQFNELLNHAKDKGWADFRIDDFGDTRWFITESGELLLFRS